MSLCLLAALGITFRSGLSFLNSLMNLFHRCKTRDHLSPFAAPPHLQQLHNKPSQQNYDDLIGAVTKSASRRAEMKLMDIFVIALEYIKDVRRIAFGVTLVHRPFLDEPTWPETWGVLVICFISRLFLAAFRLGAPPVFVSYRCHSCTRLL